MKKKYVFLLIIVMFFCVLSACSRSIDSPVDELITRNWEVKNPSGISATLRFMGGIATFTIYDSDESVGAVISGVLAADNKKFYITSQKLHATFEFEYRVFGDRAEITYGGQTLTFSPLENTSPDEV